MRSFGYTLKQAFVQFGRNFNTGIVSIFAITAMLMILGVFFIAAINTNMAAEAIRADYDSIELYLEDDMTQESAEEIMADLQTMKGVEEAVYRTKDEAMADFRKRWGENGYLLDSLSENPLPDSIIVKISDLDLAEGIAEKCAGYEGIEDVKFYKNTVDKLLKITDYMQIAAAVIMIFLIIISIIVVSNTIKLTVFNRAEEISIMKYIGATNWFIRGPFLVEGIIIGVISAGISVGICALVYHKLMELLGEQLITTLGMPMVPEEFLIKNIAWIFAALGVSIGACGSIISMRKFLNT